MRIRRRSADTLSAKIECKGKSKKASTVNPLLINKLIDRSLDTPICAPYNIVMECNITRWRATMCNQIFRTRHMCVPQGEREKEVERRISSTCSVQCTMLSWALAYVKPSLKSGLSERCVRLCSLGQNGRQAAISQKSWNAAKLSQAAHSFQYVTHGRAATKKKTMHGRQKPELKRRLGQAKQPQPPPQLRSLEAAAVAIHRRREREDFSWVFAYVPNARLQFSIMQL